VEGRFAMQNLGARIPILVHYPRLREKEFKLTSREDGSYYTRTM
jgi:hypothetical protein